MNFPPIGAAHTPFPDRFGCPRQPGIVPGALGFLEIFKAWQPELSLQGLQDYSHLWILFCFHTNQNQHFTAKVHPPRWNGKSLGVFATRTPHRPNPIGLSLVQIQEVTPEGIWVQGIDLQDQTPILDLKPYLPEVESVTSAAFLSPEGKTQFSEHSNLSFQPKQKAVITWTPVAQSQLLAGQTAARPKDNETSYLSVKSKFQLRSRLSLDEVRDQIEQILSEDPRPLGAKEAGDPNKVHHLRIYDLEVCFRCLPNQQILVDRLNF